MFDSTFPVKAVDRYEWEANTIANGYSSASIYVRRTVIIPSASNCSPSAFN